MTAPVPGNILKRCNGVPEEGEGKNLLIRKATAEEMLRLWGYRDAGAAPPTARYFYRHISSGNAVFWTIEDGGELVGELYAFLGIEEDRDFADGKTAAYLCAFRIRKDHRGRGIGTGLMETALADLKEPNLPTHMAHLTPYSSSYSSWLLLFTTGGVMKVSM